MKLNPDSHIYVTRRIKSQLQMKHKYAIVRVLSDLLKADSIIDSGEIG